MKKCIHLRAWFNAHTPDQARELARRAGTSVPYLRHCIAGRRKLSAELAMQLDMASTSMGEPWLVAQKLSAILAKYWPNT